MAVVAPGKEWAAGYQLCEDAPDGPDVDRLCTQPQRLVLVLIRKPVYGELGGTEHGARTDLGVHLEREHNFRRTVPPCGDVLRHEARLLAAGVRRARAAREPEVAHLEITVRVEEQVRGLQIAVDDVRGVHRLQRAERLVDEVLAVVIGQRLRPDDAVQVCLHQLLDDWRPCSGELRDKIGKSNSLVQ